jgi:AcrR family transcriptional regulator
MPAKIAEDKPASSRSKRDAILAAATTYFGREGYEDSKWADVAKEVGIGSTALYHYFESKLHCLYVIMADARGSYRGLRAHHRQVRTTSRR